MSNMSSSNSFCYNGKDCFVHQDIGTVTMLIQRCIKCSVTLFSIFHNKIADELVIKHHLCYNASEFKTDFVSFFMIQRIEHPIIIEKTYNNSIY